MPKRKVSITENSLRKQNYIKESNLNTENVSLTRESLKRCFYLYSTRWSQDCAVVKSPLDIKGMFIYIGQLKIS